MARPKTPPVASDCVAIDAKGRVLLVRRKHPPHVGGYALPGGFVDIGESVEDACRRELMEETGIKAGRLRLVGVYSDPERDPRGHSVAIAFLTRVGSGRPVAGDDAADAAWVDDWRAQDLAFDHREIIEDAMRLLRKTQRPSR